ncbi:uncharacterized protein BJ171DRAFT_423626 [Polychytrium aggregatum]|uniref:uncharacterized protein n=1 Tax=Polychytrium aggregatum TaxID=110093 RepID=UPI0022FE3F4D|nr:uncharacterized protein BJ171DRAFT_423626 [Polychytrium aggregatum]KAI9205037.1 hypothetical protein BJ171DRAFT_423626 [Polychytrium aggregatum]
MIRTLESDSNVIKQYRNAFSSIYKQSKHPKELHAVVSAIALTQARLTPVIISNLLGLDIGTVRASIQELGHVIDAQHNGRYDSTISRLKTHKSVSSFLLSEQSLGERFHVPGRLHVVLASRCLQVILSHEPTINICDVYDLHDKVPDFEDKVKSKISPTLRYSVASWISHFVQYKDAGLIELLSRFVSSHAFFWLECGSLIKSIKPIIDQLDILWEAIARAPNDIIDNKTNALVWNIRRFLQEFSEPIAASAPQVYNSGYVFTPKDSLIYKTYASALEDKMPFLVTAGLPRTWDSAWEPSRVSNCLISGAIVTPQGEYILGSDSDWKNGDSSVWDAFTGQYYGSLPYGANFKTARLSNDRSFFVASTRSRLIICDANNYSLRHTLTPTSGGVQSFAITDDDTKIVSGYGDTVDIWDVATGERESGLTLPRPKGRCNVYISVLTTFARSN